jgi:hypothetical protein
MEASKGFDIQIIERALDRKREGTFFDFKLTYHDLRYSEKKEEFCKDAIAMANVARRTGLPAYLIFGIGDMNGVIDDVSSQSPYQQTRSENTSLEKWMQDFVHAKFSDLLKPPNVNLTIEFNFEYGPFKEGFVSYLQFLPQYPSKPYCLKKPIRKNQQDFRERIYVRYGSRSVQLDPADAELWERLAHLAYFSMKDWKEYIEKYRQGDFERFFEVGTAMPPQVEVEGQTRDALEYLLEAIANSSQRIFVLEGPAGIGKTIALHRLVYQLAKNMPDEFSNSELGEPNGTCSLSEHELVTLRSIEVFPPEPIPVFVSLRQGAIRTEECFRELIVKEICEKVGKDFRKLKLNLDSFLEMPFTKWVICLDGLDEVSVKGNLKEILIWLQRFPSNVWIVLTSRPFTGFPESFAKLKMLPHRPEDVYGYIRRELLLKQVEEKDVDALLRAIDKNSSLNELLCYPRYMRALLDSYLFPDQEKLPANDRDQPMPLVRPAEFSPAISNAPAHSIPIADVEILETPDAIEADHEEDEDIQEASEAEMAPPTDGRILTWLINYMYDQESKRLIGVEDPSTKIQKARDAIRWFAFRLDWSKKDFSIAEFESAQKGRCKIMKINQRMNLIVRETSKNSFFTPLLHWFFAAEYMIEYKKSPNGDRLNSDRVLALAQQINPDFANL